MVCYPPSHRRLGALRLYRQSIALGRAFEGTPRMDNQGSRYRGSVRPVRRVVLICSHANWELPGLHELRKVRQRSPQIIEFIGPAEEEPSCTTEILLAEYEVPRSGSEIWKLGPPLELIACAQGTGGCIHT